MRNSAPVAADLRRQRRDHGRPCAHEAAEKALPGYAAFAARHNELRNALASAEREVRDARADVTRMFPDYAALADPQPLTRAETQRLLREDEALVAILVGSERSFVWAVTKDRAEWAQLDIGAEALAREVTTLRLGLDPPRPADG